MARVDGWEQLGLSPIPKRHAKTMKKIEMLSEIAAGLVGVRKHQQQQSKGLGLCEA